VNPVNEERSYNNRCKPIFNPMPNLATEASAFRMRRHSQQYMRKYFGLDVLTEVVIKNPVFWDITPCCPLKINRNFGEIFRLHLQDRRINQARNQYEEVNKQQYYSCFCLPNIILRP
jgi:hypothetical protein